MNNEPVMRNGWPDVKKGDKVMVIKDIPWDGYVIKAGPRTVRGYDNRGGVTVQIVEGCASCPVPGGSFSESLVPAGQWVKIRRIDLDELLTGTPSWPEVVEFFRRGEWDSEEWLVLAIKKHLRTDAQRDALAKADYSIEDMLNGRTSGDFDCQAIYDAWNEKLGFRSFGH